MIPSQAQTQDPTLAAQQVLSGADQDQPQPQPQPAAQPMNATTADVANQSANQTSGDVMQGQGSVAPTRQAPPAPQPQPPAHRSLMGDILHAVGEILGGPSTTRQVNPQTGQIETVPLSREQRIANQIGVFARGAAAGAAQHGPAAIGKAALAGVQEQQEFQQQATENLQQQERLTQQQLMNRATIAAQNNEYLLSLRRFDLESNEFKQKLIDSNNALAVQLHDAGAVAIPMIVNGKDVNGTSDEASIMNWVAAHPKPARGYDYLPLFSLDSSGKMVHTVMQFPHDALNDMVTIPVQQARDLGIPVPATQGDTVDIRLGQAIAARSAMLKDMNTQSEIDVHGQQMKTSKTEATKNIAEANLANSKANKNAQISPGNMLVGSMPDGSQVAGTADELQRAGASGIMKLDADNAKKTIIARQLIAPGGLFQQVNADLRQLDAQGKIGVVASRWNDFMSGKVGSGPEFAALRTHMGLLATALMQAHVGARGSNEMLEHFKSLADYRIADAKTLRSALGAEYGYVQEKAMLPKAPLPAPVAQ